MKSDIMAKFLIGLILGPLGLAILNRLITRPKLKCRNCGNEINIWK